MTQPIPLNICIYCGRTDVELTDEHIIPKGFGNTAGDILHKASCKDCAAITGAFELTMLRENLQPIRTAMRLASRRGTPTTIPQLVEYTDGRQETIDVPHDKYLGSIGLPIFTPPSVLQLDYARTYLDAVEIQTFNIGKVANVKWYQERGIVQFHNYFFKSNKQQAFARFILKVSYCAAVKYYGYERVKNSPIPLIILNKNPHIAVWLGCLGWDTFPEPPAKNGLIRYAVGEIENNRLLVSLQFFPEIGDSPIYHTVII